MKQEMITRSQENFGNPKRILQAFEKARRGEEVTYVALGGSITQGFSATDRSKTCYAALIAAWWEKTFPQAKINFINAGIGATGSLIGVHRLSRDVLAFNPDFVVVEFGVNDYDRRNIDADQTYSNLIARLVADKSKTGVLALNMTTSAGGNTQEVHLPIAKYYDVPYISFASAVIPEWTADESLKTTWTADGTHPTDEGHAIAAGVVCAYLDSLLDKKSEDYPEPQEKPAYINEKFANAQIYYVDELEYKKPCCFEKGKTYSTRMEYGWKTTVNGDPLVFELKNVKSVHILFERTNKGNGGKAVAEIDGQTFDIDSNFQDGWGVYANSTRLLDLDTPKDVTLKIIPKLEEGKEFALIAVMTA